MENNLILEGLLSMVTELKERQEKQVSVGDSVRNPLPKERPKNWLYHKTPAKAQNNRLLPQTADFL